MKKHEVFNMHSRHGFTTKFLARNLAQRFVCGYCSASPLKKTGHPYLSYSVPGLPSIRRPVAPGRHPIRSSGGRGHLWKVMFNFVRGVLRFEFAQRKNIRL